ncbi:TauD/TfdA family dioxygenase [Nitrospirillum sp. BR 11163]|uniref:TauD/TfdA dioxygenase family protein n=1 Tax=Nitrospirillum sp. BR 11163 TaxID=3104323 RepID=UPI002AFEC1F9|nr:TauD/TfdA family dioxygenase [Nitrospirillum sp. BR 11163]MEA1674733.1 TauD/TfdA family dioxygenase [Nitrospirillum sp. BR 11163]
MTAAARTPDISADTFEIRDIPGVLGAEVIGLDLSQPLPESDFLRIRRALAERQVVVVRGQGDLTPEQHIAFSRRFGPLEIHIQHHFHLPGHPEILVVSNVMENGKPIGLADAGRYWHSDLSYMALPSLGSLLHAREIPEGAGDTLFASLAAAYEALPEETQRRLQTLTAEHGYAARNRAQQAVTGALRPGLTAEQEAKVPPVIHPVVRVHPETGRRSLFISEGFTSRIVELPEEESRALLAELFAHSIQDRFIYRHRWRPDDLVIWDNRQGIHLATGVPPDVRRTLYRTTVQGDKPRGIAAA